MRIPGLFIGFTGYLVFRLQGRIFNACIIENRTVVVLGNTFVTCVLLTTVTYCESYSHSTDETPQPVLPNLSFMDSTFFVNFLLQFR